MVHEYIRALILLYKTVTFAFIKPFDNSIGHFGILLPLEFCGSKLQAANVTNGSFRQNETGPHNKDAAE
jgi:hypothetical protein